LYQTKTLVSAGFGDVPVEQIANLHIEKLPEGVYLATCEDIPGLIAQGRTVTETLEIARDVARKLLDAQVERSGSSNLAPVGESFDLPLVLGA
jgi:predicted RNase H-like HicB family nuclease